MGQGPEHSGVVSPAPPQYPAAHGPSQATEAEPSALYEPAAQATGVADVAATPQKWPGVDVQLPSQCDELEPRMLYAPAEQGAGVGDVAPATQ